MSDPEPNTFSEEPPSRGYGKPPKAGQFRKGQSGNPKGRPKGKRNSEIPYQTVLGQMVTVREQGRERRVTAAEAFILQLTQKGLAGDSAAARTSLAAIETARVKNTAIENPGITKIVMVPMQTECVLRTLAITIKKYPADEKRVRWEINPWAIEAALGRLGDRRLTQAEQREVWKCTRTPHKVAWPEWWAVRDDP